MINERVVSGASSFYVDADMADVPGILFLRRLTSCSARVGTCAMTQCPALGVTKEGACPSPCCMIERERRLTWKTITRRIIHAMIRRAMVNARVISRRVILCVSFSIKNASLFIKFVSCPMSGAFKYPPLSTVLVFFKLTATPNREGMDPYTVMMAKTRKRKMVRFIASPEIDC